MRHIPGLFISESNKGKSVFTAEIINVDDVIEACPVIMIPETEKSLIHKTVLHDYYFIWPTGGIIIALGYGSIYNHSRKPNAQVVFDLDNDEMIVQCLRIINPGEEVLIDYAGGDPDLQLWFKDINN